jgi:hypothetical protein
MIDLWPLQEARKLLAAAGPAPAADAEAALARSGVAAE